MSVWSRVAQKIKEPRESKVIRIHATNGTLRSVWGVFSLGYKHSTPTERVGVFSPGYKHGTPTERVGVFSLGL